MIKFTNVTKTYENNNNNEIHALNNVSLDIKKGEFVFVVGSSGAGKSTLTKLLIAEFFPTEGEIIVGDTNLGNLTRKEIPYYRRTIGMVFQDFRLLENKTVYENVAFALEIVGATRRQIRRRVPDALSRVGLATKASRYPHELSGGEQQRIAIARAIVNNPQIIIADEPTGNLDPRISKEIMDMLLEINKGGATVIVVTHDKTLVDLMKKRVILLDGGKIVADEERGAYNEVTLI
ncbi:MAG: cell division ATP-binding protein FtsE [Clostridia bacterium]|nr:cell division ATP-binding protein FtsE [Clostridia bacterium]